MFCRVCVRRLRQRRALPWRPDEEVGAFVTADGSSDLRIQAARRVRLMLAGGPHKGLVACPQWVKAVVRRACLMDLPAKVY